MDSMPNSIAPAIGTVITRSYLPFARVLVRSIREYHPDVKCYVVVLDGDDEPDSVEDFEILALDALRIPGTKHFLFRYPLRQAVTASKAYLLSMILDRGHSRAVYLDSDILVVGSLRPLLTPTDNVADIILTPHLLEPPPIQNNISRELTILQAGVYNGGCISVANTSNGREFLGWFEQRLHDYCLQDIPRGLHCDQRWIDLVPSYFQGARVERDPGLNVAYWNLPERKLEGDVIAGLRVQGGSCKFFHFSGFDPLFPESLTKYGMELPGPVEKVALKLAAHYADLLAKADDADYLSSAYAFATFSDNTQIPGSARLLFSQLDASTRDTFADPFDVGCSDSFRAYLDEPVDDVEDPTQIITRFWKSEWDARPDLQREFPFPLESNRADFLRWIRTSRTEHSGWEHFLAPQDPQSDPLAWPFDTHQFADGTVIPESARRLYGTLDGNLKRLFGDPRDQSGESTFRAFLDASADEVDDPELVVTNLWLAIHSEREDLRTAFPDPLGHDRRGYIEWIHNSSASEHPDTAGFRSPEFIRPSREGQDSENSSE